MDTTESIKSLVREKYGEIAQKASQEGGCGCGCGPTEDISMLVGDAYDHIDGYVAEADLKLGCGVPTEYAEIEPGQTVLDLGSGAGLDVFAARSIVGEIGRVIGVDMTPEMIARARENADKLGFTNVEFLQGDIEQLPLESDTVDVIISNCVLNLVPDKAKAFAEMYRVLKPGGHFCVSDIVTRGSLPAAIQRAAELYVGCVSGAVEREAYNNVILNTGFKNIDFVKQDEIPVPAEALRGHLSKEDMNAFYASDSRVLSVTVKGVK